MEEQLSFTSIYNPNSHTSKLCEKLLTFSEIGQFSDICIISSDNVKFHSHKNILSAASDYFMAMFDGGLKKPSSTQFDIFDEIEKVLEGILNFCFGLFGLRLKPNNQKPSFPHVKIEEICGIVLKVILTFVYTGRIELRSETEVEDILRGAIFLQIQDLITECNNLMIEKLDVNNCLGMLMFADQHDLFELSKKVSKFASLNFDKIINQEDFLKLDENQLSEIISSEDLCMSSEENVYLSLVKWIDHDKPNRKQSTMELFSKIRYWLLSPTFIRKHRSKLPQQIEFLNMVCTWLEWHSLPDNWREIKPVVFSQPMKPGLLFVGGGKIQKYDEKLNIWTFGRFSKLPHFKTVVSVKNKLVFVSDYRNSPIECFDLQTREVTNLPKKNLSRRYDYPVVLNDELYIISSRRRLVEKYNFSTGKWYNVTPMNTEFACARAAVANGKLYVLGAKPPIMDIFNPDTNDWTSVPAEDDERWDFGFTEVGGKLYKFGGRKQINIDSVFIYFTNVKRYDPVSNIWEEMERLEIALAFLGKGGASLNNKLIICGGIDYSNNKYNNDYNYNYNYLNLVQEYDPDTNKWKTLPPLIEYENDIHYDLVVLN